MFCLAVHNYQLSNPQKQFFISNIYHEQSLLTTVALVFSFSEIFPRGLFSFSGSDGGQSGPDPRFKMILWFIIAGTRGGINRAKILNLLKTAPMNANKIATVMNLDYKTILHHVKILSKNNLVVKEEKDYGAEYQLTQIMKENQSTLEEIMQKIGTK